MTRRSFLALTFASAALARRWDEHPFPHWNEDFIDRILTNSPWAKPWRSTVVKAVPDRLVSSFSQIGIGLPSPLPGGGSWPRGPRNQTPFPRIPSDADAGPLRVAVDLTVRWASALPIRQAMALQEFGPNHLNEDRAQQMLVQPDEFVIELAGIPRVLAVGGEKKLVKDLEATRLAIPGHRIVSPDSVRLPTIGMYLTATLRFPRVNEIPLEGRAIELSVVIGSEPMEQQFKLEPMVYAGQLQL